MLCMFEKFTQENRRDFATRYEGTYGFFYREGTKKFLTRLEVVGEAVKFVDAKGVSYELMPDSVEDTGFEFLPPKAGFFNTARGAMFVFRRAQRQFSRGISERNTIIYLLDDKAGGLLPMTVDFSNLTAVYESTLTGKDQWERFVSGKLPSVAIGKQFAITRKTVYVLDVKVGKVAEATGKRVKLLLTNDQFKTELRDNFRNNELEVEFL